MNTITLLVGLLLCLAIVEGRSYSERQESDIVSDSENDGIKSHNSQTRHRRRRWQSNYGYDYPPHISPYYPERREYSQQDLLPKVVRLLEEISEYIKRPQPPPPPPQPIYIPYPVPYPVPQYTACTPVNAKNPNVTIRFPEMEDTNQNWGFYVEENNNQDEGDGSRPISFDPIKPIRPMKRPTPKVDHNSEQADNQQVTEAPKLEDGALGRTPQMCNAAIVSCCADENQKQCFNTFGCGVTYNGGKACIRESVNQAIDALKEAYSPRH